MADLPVGETIGERYRVLGNLGRGASAVVYLALDTRLDTTVAVKVLGAEQRNQDRRRLANEAKALARIRHPGVVAVHDVEVGGDPPYLVMEHCPGGTLGDRLRVGPLTVPEAIHVLRAVLNALAAVHAEGLVHRDIKVTNVLFDGLGAPRLADFGIVRIASLDDTQLTRTGTGMGTLSYAAPEQVLDSRRVDGRADLYATGAMFLKMLTGRNPDLLYQPEGHHRQFADVPEAVRRFVIGATRADPDRRFQSAAAMLAGVDRMEARLAGRSPLADEPPAEPRATWRSRAIWATGAAVTAAALGAIALITLIGVAASGRVEPRSPISEPSAVSSAVAAPSSGAPSADGASSDASDLAPSDVARSADGASSGGARTTAPDAAPSAVRVQPIADAAPAVDTRAQRTGTAYVNGVPPGALSIDGRSVGSTPWSGVVTAGGRRLALTGPDGAVVERTLDVPSDGEARFCWDFREASPCRR